MNVNCLDKAGESNQQNTQQRKSCNANVPARVTSLQKHQTILPLKQITTTRCDAPHYAEAAASLIG